LAVGAVADGVRLGGWIEDRLGDQIDAATPPPTISAVFPSADSVRGVTCRGCSCDLLIRCQNTARPEQDTTDAVLLTPACRLAIAALVRRLGEVRLYVTSSRTHFRGAQPRISMTVWDLLSLTTQIPAFVLVDVVAGASPAAGIEI
jgi:hypothetical protein